MTPWFFIRHRDAAEFLCVDESAVFCEVGIGIGSEDSWQHALSQDALLTVTADRIKTQTTDRFSTSYDVRDQGHEGNRVVVEAYYRIADAGLQWNGDLSDCGDLHVRSSAGPCEYSP